jgi:hypothetical protein
LEKMAEKMFVLPIIAAIIIMALVLPGCVSTSEGEGTAQPLGSEFQPGQDGFQSGQDAAPQYPGGFRGDSNYSGPRGNFTGSRDNFTGGARNFSPEFEQQLIAACAGKAQGDNCTMTTPRGETAGVCEARNATLSCMPRFNAQDRPPA